ncbi:MAG: L-lactate permease [Hespellia sp.]|nr:L-lactate permease [Hespellia sp.]
MFVLKFVLAILPILWLVIALSGLKWPGYKACGVCLLLSVILALVGWKMGLVNTLTACLEGVLTALWPICLVIVAAIFTYNITLKTGAMDTIKKMLTSVSNDKRVLVLIIAWTFGNFMEGIAGFGTSVAIPGSMLAGLGFHPLTAIALCLIANTVPTAFGSVGIPTVTLSTVTGLEVGTLSASTALIQLPIMLLTPFILVALSGKGLKALKGMIPTTLICSVSFAFSSWLTAAYIGPELPDIIGFVVGMVCTIGAAKIFNRNPDKEYAIYTEEELKQSEHVDSGAAVKAWMPFILIFVLLLLTSKLVAPINNMLSVFKSSFVIYTGENASTISFSWINTPGIWIFLSAIIGGKVQGASFGVMGEVFTTTMKNMTKTIATICAVLATAKVMSYSGMIADIASFFVAVTGGFYPLIAPAIGALGGFVTGSGTSTTVLFGGLQSQTANALGMSESWLASANTMGAGIGKMISPQSIAIGLGAVNMVGSESVILKKVVPYFLLNVIVAGLACYIGVLLF